jgi:hypothetical protein
MCYKLSNRDLFRSRAPPSLCAGLRSCGRKERRRKSLAFRRIKRLRPYRYGWRKSPSPVWAELKGWCIFTVDCRPSIEQKRFGIEMGDHGNPDFLSTNHRIPHVESCEAAINGFLLITSRRSCLSHHSEIDLFSVIKNRNLIRFHPLTILYSTPSTTNYYNCLLHKSDVRTQNARKLKERNRKMRLLFCVSSMQNFGDDNYEIRMI